MVLAVLAADRRAHEPAVHEHRVARQVARVVVPRRARGAPRHPSSAASTLEMLTVADRARRHLPRLHALPARASSTPTATRSTRSSAASRPCSATPTTTTTASPGSSTVPAARFASWLDRVVDNKIIDGTVNGVGWLVQRAGPRRPTTAGRPRAALRARHHRRHRRGAPLRRDLGWGGRRGLPDPLGDHR